MKAEFMGLVGLNAFEFVDVKVVAFAWKVDKDGNVLMKPKGTLVKCIQ